MDQGTPGNGAQALKAEITRLKAKLSQTEDKDIREALKLKIEATQVELDKLAATEVEVEPEPEEVPEPATPEQIAAAERLIQQAHVEKIRGNKARALELMKEAATTAPGSVVVLEALGDDYVDRKLYKEAQATYKKALQLDPKNIGLDKKHALLVFRTHNLGSFEDQMRAAMGDSPFVSREEALANRKFAVVYNAFLPGLGQIVLGETVRGALLLIGWVGCLLWMILLRDDFAKLVRFSAGREGSGLSLGVMFPMVIAAVIYISALVMASSKAKSAPKRQTIDRPTPPMDLPFE